MDEGGKLKISTIFSFALRKLQHSWNSLKVLYNVIV